MDEKKEDGSCGTSCGSCVCKAIKAVILLLIGGAIGFFIGRGCGAGRRMCSLSEAPATQMESAQTPLPTPAPVPKKTK